MKGRQRVQRIIALFLVAVLALTSTRTEMMRNIFAAESSAGNEVSSPGEAEVSEKAGTDEERSVDASIDGSDEVAASEDSEDAESDTEEEKEDILLSKYVEDSGCTVTINAAYESLPYDKDELDISVREILPDTMEYEYYFGEAVKALDGKSKDDVTFARFFDIEILKNGEKIEPNAPVSVKIEYDKDEAPEIKDDAELSIVHFAEDGTEVIDDVDVNKDATEIKYEQESFSVTATILTEVPADTTNTNHEGRGDPYFLTAKVGDKVYIVLRDGSLKEVSYDSGNNKIVSDEYMTWSYFYVKRDWDEKNQRFNYPDGFGASQYQNKYLRYATEGYDYGSDNLASTFAYTYIDPTVESGMSTEVPKKDGSGNDVVVGGKTQFDTPNDHCAIVFDGTKLCLKDKSKYIGVSFDGDEGKIVGNCASDDQKVTGVEFYLAKASDVPSTIASWDYPKNNVVNHIDISISDEVAVDIPLAYGTYYDANGNVAKKVTSDTYITVRKKVSIESEYLKNAVITAYKGSDPSKTALNDMYFITGYSSNSETDLSTDQVRIEGMFKVSDLAPYTGACYQKVDPDDPDSAEVLTDAYRQYMAKRLLPENQIRYQVVATQPNVEFEYNDETLGQLYDSKGNPLSVEATVTITANFGYWDEEIKEGDVIVQPGNECPPISKKWGCNDPKDSQEYRDYVNEVYTEWTNGGIFRWGGSGMDFKLLGESKADPMNTSLEITKDILSVDGDKIYPKKAVTGLSFDIYQDGGGSPMVVDDLNVDTYTKEPDYNEEDFVKTKTLTMDIPANENSNIVNDHNNMQGMTYIKEDKDSIPDYIIDKDNKIWVYRNTRMETEYVWRKDGDEDKTHKSDTYTKENGSYKSIPEILGDYNGDVDSDGDGKPDDLYNGFLEFYVHNIYEEYKPAKKEVLPYEGTGELGGVKAGDEITYEISYKNYKNAAATVKIEDILDPNVEFVSATNGGACADGKVTWTLSNVQAGKEGTVRLTVKVKESALESKGGPGKVFNGGGSTDAGAVNKSIATVQVDDDSKQTLEEVSNPVPDAPEKKETAPYDGKGTLGQVSDDSEITYTIKCKNYKSTAADIVITDTLDTNVEFVRASDDGVSNGGKVTWTLRSVPAGTEKTVSLTVKVLPSALVSEGGPGKVVNGGDTSTVKVGNDDAFTLNEVENPVIELPHKTETAPYEGTGRLGGVDVDKEITYEISYTNYKSEAANVVISDELDANVEFVSASDGGVPNDGKVTWNIANVPAGTSDKVTLKVKVLAGALKSEGGLGYVKNGGPTTTVKIGNDPAYELEEITNPVPKGGKKEEILPYEGIGELGEVVVGQEITYRISYENYNATPVDVAIVDELDTNVEFVNASDNGAFADGKVTWNIADVPADSSHYVELTVKVLPGALKSKGGPGEVVNGGSTSTVKVGNDLEQSLEVVKNPVYEPHKKEVTPYEGTGELGGVKVGDEITYEISYKNYKNAAATVKIEDKLDPNVEFVSATDRGAFADGKVTWTLSNVSAGEEGTVKLTVKVKESATLVGGGPGKVFNGGGSNDPDAENKSIATVQVDDDPKQTLEEVENPVPEEPVKIETEPYYGNGKQGAVKVGDIITYEISYLNYKSEAADIVIEDTLDKNAGFVEASDGGTFANGKVTWTLRDVSAGSDGTVELKVKVLPGALKENGGPGNVVNGGDGTGANAANGSKAFVTVGTDNPFPLDEVENPVPENPHKKEVSPYEGNGTLGAVKVGDEITYEITYRNYKDAPATIYIEDILDKNAEFVSASGDAVYSDAIDYAMENGGMVRWTLNNVPAGTEGSVKLTVKVKEGALKSNGGSGSLFNGGDPYDPEASNGSLARVAVDDDVPFNLETVENPVPEVPVKEETAPYKGNGVLGPVSVGEIITYSISYENYKKEAADIVITDILDKNVDFVSAAPTAARDGKTVTWTLKNVAAGTKGVVTLNVRVRAEATKENGGPGYVINGGDGTDASNGSKATVKVGSDNPFILEKVENPVPNEPFIPTKKETAPYEGNGMLGEVKADDVITYEITYKNYKDDAADIVITDKLDKNVTFVSASSDGAFKDGIVTWNLKAVPAGKTGSVTLTVKVNSSALKSNGGPGIVINGGDGTDASNGSYATVKVGDDPEYMLSEVKNPLVEETSSGSKKDSPKSTPKKTGDAAPITMVIIISIISFVGIIILATRKKRNKNA